MHPPSEAPAAIAQTTPQALALSGTWTARGLRDLGSERGLPLPMPTRNRTRRCGHRGARYCRSLGAASMAAAVARTGLRSTPQWSASWLCNAASRRRAPGVPVRRFPDAGCFLVRIQTQWPGDERCRKNGIPVPKCC